MSDVEFLRKVILNVFKDQAGGLPEMLFSKIERRCGIQLEQVAPANVERFLQAVAEELRSILSDEWKASFVTTVIKNVLKKQGLVH